jgi:hypothetical protein
LSGAGEWVQASQIGRSQVPFLFVGTVQSQSSGAGCPQAQRFCRPRDVQTMAR